MIRIFLPTLILATITNNNQITIACHQCGSQTCLTPSGGPFNGYVYPTSASSCSSSYPVSYFFECGQENCPNSSCQILINSPGQSSSLCTNSIQGQNILNLLNLLYSAQEGQSNDYNWCGCGLTLTLILIIVGVSLLALVFGGIGIYVAMKVNKKRKQEEAQMNDILVVQPVPMTPVVNDEARKAAEEGSIQDSPYFTLPHNHQL